MNTNMIQADLSNPRTFLFAYGEWLERRNAIENESTCTLPLHGRWLCCPAHRLLQAELSMLEIWAHYFDTTFEMYEMYGNVLSKKWMNEFQRRICQQG